MKYHNFISQFLFHFWVGLGVTCNADSVAIYLHYIFLSIYCVSIFSGEHLDTLDR